MKKIIHSALLLGTTFSLMACSSHDHAAEASHVSLHNCVIQETIPGAKATGAFLSIKKHGQAELSLVSAEAPSITPHVEIHEMSMKNGTMKMQQIKSYPLAEGENVFQKGGYHIMLMGIKKPVVAGEHHPLTLTFSDGSSQSCKALVKSVDSIKSKHKMHKDMHKKHSH